MVYIIISAVLLLPWLIIPVAGIPEPTRLIKASFFDFMCMGIIVYTLINGMKFKYKNKYLGWLTAWVFFTMACNWYYPLIRGLGYNAGTIESSIHYILALITTIFVCSNLDSDDFYKISKAIALSLGLVCSYAILQIIGQDPMAHIAGYVQKENRHVSALLDHPDLLGNYIAIGIPFLLYLKGNKYKLVMMISLVVLYFCHSNLSIMAAIVGGMIYFGSKFIKNKKFPLILTSVLLILGCIILNPHFNKLNSGFTGRTEAWGEMVHRTNNPAFGEGLGIVKSLMVKFGDNYWMYAHNDYLEIWCALGTLGLVLLLLVIIHSLRNFNYNPENSLGFSFMASFVAFLIICFGSFPMEIAPLALGGLISFWGVERLS